MIVTTQSHHSVETAVKKPRSSNLELYRIICMLMIVAHHYVVNSGLTSINGPLRTSPTATNSLFLALFGAWGKTGINCFLMITGYFMCTSKITIKKFLKLLGQIYFYRIIIYLIFLFTGYQAMSMEKMVKLIMPIWGLKNNFTSCFLVFWLTIPFLSILVQNLNKRQHELLLLLALGCYTVLGSIPGFDIRFNYVTWFGVLFFIASYIKLYPRPIFEKRKLWGWTTWVVVFLAMVSIVFLQIKFGDRGIVDHSFFFVSDCNKIFAVLVAVSSFLWFKNMDIPQSKIINAIGGSTFGVFLIHTNSASMRTWLWKDTVDCVGHYSLPLGNLILYCVGVVLAVFIICNLIDQLRIATVERWFFKWYDCKIALKVDRFVNKILQKQ